MPGHPQFRANAPLLLAGARPACATWSHRWQSDGTIPRSSSKRWKRLTIHNVSQAITARGRWAGWQSEWSSRSRAAKARAAGYGWPSQRLRQRRGLQVGTSTAAVMLAAPLHAIRCNF